MYSSILNSIMALGLSIFSTSDDIHKTSDIPEKVSLALTFIPGYCSSQYSKINIERRCVPYYKNNSNNIHEFYFKDLFFEDINKIYCGVDKNTIYEDKYSVRKRDFSDLPAVNITDDLYAILNDDMLGSRVYRFERHSWLKNGTCFTNNANKYFKAGLSLYEYNKKIISNVINSYPSGKELSSKDILKTIAIEYGDEYANSLVFICMLGPKDSRIYLTEVRVLYNFNKDFRFELRPKVHRSINTFGYCNNNMFYISNFH